MSNIKNIPFSAPHATSGEFIAKSQFSELATIPMSPVSSLSELSASETISSSL